MGEAKDKECTVPKQKQAYYSEQIRMLGKTYYAEEKDHKDLVCCKSGAFYAADLYFSGCKTVGEYWDWKKEPSHELHIRYWEDVPTDGEREKEPWKPYILQRKGIKLVERITKEQFLNLERTEELMERHVEEFFQDTIKTEYSNKDDTIMIAHVKG
jgi:hypothetical protein